MYIAMRNLLIVLACLISGLRPIFVAVDAFVLTIPLRHAKQQSFLARRSSANSFTVQYGEALELQVPIAANETLLAAMERIPALQGYIPHDCRKSTCLTCVARCCVIAAPTDEQQQKHNNTPPVVFETNDGLSPSVALDRQYVLPCSTTLRSAASVSNASSSIVLSLNDDHHPAHYDVWKEVYQQRLGHPDRSSAARAMRKHAERNVQSWMEQTEGALLQQTGASTLTSLAVDDDGKVEGALE